jgi:hypothetical protein
MSINVPTLFLFPTDRTPETLAGLREANGQVEECPCKTDSGGWWIQCDLCAQWYHGPCQKLKKAQQESDERYAYVKPRGSSRRFRGYPCQPVKPVLPVCNGNFLVCNHDAIMTPSLQVSVHWVPAHAAAACRGHPEAARGCGQAAHGPAACHRAGRNRPGGGRVGRKGTGSTGHCRSVCYVRDVVCVAAGGLVLVMNGLCCMAVNGEHDVVLAATRLCPM